MVIDKHLKGKLANTSTVTASVERQMHYNNDTTRCSLLRVDIIENDRN